MFGNAAKYPEIKLDNCESKIPRNAFQKQIITHPFLKYLVCRYLPRYWKIVMLAKHVLTSLKETLLQCKRHWAYKQGSDFFKECPGKENSNPIIIAILLFFMQAHQRSLQFLTTCSWLSYSLKFTLTHKLAAMTYITVIKKNYGYKIKY